MRKKRRTRLVLAQRTRMKISLRKLVFPCALLVLIFVFIFLYLNFGNSKDTLASVENKFGKITLTTSIKFVSTSLIELNWTTESETNNDYFTLERSENGIDYFEIGKMQGAGNSTFENTYRFADNLPVEGDIYYRISQTDYNGATTKFNPFPVSFNDSILEGLQINYAGQNEFDKHLLVEYHSEEPGVAEIRLLNSKGKLMFSEQGITLSGLNTFSFADAGTLEKGNYFIQLVEGDHETTPAKVIIK